MRFQTQKKHMIDLLFPVALFFVFALSALTVILLATNVYQKATARSSLNYTAGTSLSYISEKIRQNDAAGAVSLGTFDGCKSLILQQEIQDETYFTYIFVKNGNLNELFVKDGVNVSADAGTVIMPVNDFSMEQVGEQLFRFTCTDTNGEQSSTVVGVRSGI